MTQHAHGWIRAGIVSILLMLAGYGLARAQVSNQDVVNAEHASQLRSLDDRLKNIEHMEPAVIASRLAALEDRVNDQQKLLFGILGAVIINILASGRGGAVARTRDKISSIISTD